MAKDSGTVIGGDVLAKNIVDFENKFLQSVNKGMQKISGMLDRQVTKNISLSDHSLSDLARMGHPYRRGGPGLHTPKYQVHTQSGELLSGKVSGTDDAEIIGGKLSAAAWVGIADFVEHAKYVIYGTTTMVPRDFLGGSLREVKDPVYAVLKTILRDTTINYNGKRVKL